MEKEKERANINSKQLEEFPSSVESIRMWLLQRLSEYLDMDVDDLDSTVSLREYGLDSLDAAVATGELEDWLELELPENLFEICKTVDALKDYLADMIGLKS